MHRWSEEQQERTTKILLTQLNAQPSSEPIALSNLCSIRTIDLDSIREVTL
jgi:hypothetical protein